jgi:hypothetical protein
MEYIQYISILDQEFEDFTGIREGINFPTLKLRFRWDPRLGAAEAHLHQSTRDNPALDSAMRWRQPQVTHTKHRRSAYHLKRLITCKHVKLSWGKPEMSLEEAAVPGGSSCPMEWSKLSKLRSWGQMSFRSHACPTFWTKEVPLMCECLPSAASNPGLASEHNQGH